MRSSAIKLFIECCLKLGCLIPKNIASYLVGRIFRIERPRFVAALMVRVFAWLFKLDMTEAQYPLSHYRTVEQLFTRRLKPGMRPVATEPWCVNADGVLTHFGSIDGGRAIQAKGLTYDINELVFGENCTQPAASQLAWFQTIYLAPHNYHRVHAPASGLLRQVTHFPGELWPVNNLVAHHLPKLFIRNERLVFEIWLEGGGKVFVVMVGALNVGRIAAVMVPDFHTNNLWEGEKRSERTFSLGDGYRLKVGDELGVFSLGSTVVNVFDAMAVKSLNLTHASPSQQVLMGQALR